MAQSPRVSPWLIGSVIASAVVAYTTFQKVLTVPVVSSYVGGDLFGITGFVGSLATQYSPWLDKMMNGPTGASTAQLLSVGSIALIVLEVIAIAALVALAAHLVSGIARKTKPSRTFGLIGFALALVVPIALLVVVQFVAYQMTNDLVAIDVLALTPAPVAQAVAAVLGGVFVVLGTKTREQKAVK